jgi:hypothetical protein
MSNEKQLMLWEDIPMPYMNASTTGYHARLREWRREIDDSGGAAGTEFMELLEMAESILSDLDFHQCNSALHEMATEQQDKEIMNLRQRINAMKQEADANNAYFRENHK